MAGEYAEVKVSILVENTARKEKLWAEHGLSLLVEVKGRRILFDTGQSGEVLIHNSRELGLNLKDIDLVVLSHGHYDHTGGLASLLNEVKCIDLYTHPNAFEKKYVKADDRVKEIGSPLDMDYLAKSGVKLHLDRKPVKLDEGILLTGEIPGTTDFEEISREFLVEHDQKLVTDFLLDDQTMAIKTRKGLVVILGCSHAGVINTLKYIKSLTGTDGIHAVIGGMHLEKASISRLQLTLRAFMELGVDKVVPLHCTGFNARTEMARLLGERFELGSVGSIFEF
ncbi:MAG: MBL fold metallo-hydrolase [Firmicutes bacterium]|nr:MBL fold metallo-hydrolase [Bacillota bacterium]